MIFSFFVAGYFFGSLPFGYLISTFFFKKDIREYYSKNIGASNVSRVFGVKVGIAVFILDFLKAYLPSIVVLSILDYNNSFRAGLAYRACAVVGAGAVFGHLSSYILNFEGGKGVSAFFGAVAALNTLLACIAGVIWLVLFLLFRIPAISSLFSIAFVTTNFFLPYFWGENSFVAEKTKLILFVITITIFLKHFENITRILERKEFKV